jgi:hypothetical protein
MVPFSDRLILGKARLKGKMEGKLLSASAPCAVHQRAGYFRIESGGVY